MGQIQFLNDSNYSEALEKTQGIVLLEFYSEKYGNCQNVFQSVKEIANEHNEMTVFAINIFDGLEAVTIYLIKTLPTLVLLYNGRIAGKLIGNQSKSAIEQFIINSLTELNKELNEQAEQEALQGNSNGTNNVSALPSE